MKADYSQAGTPPEYVCGECGATGVKLWRPMNVLNPDLTCANCMQANGMTTNDIGEWFGPLGVMLPAIPSEDGTGFWGHGKIPARGARWWQNLPNVPKP